MDFEQELEEKYRKQYEESIRLAQELIDKGVLPVAKLIRENNSLEKTCNELQKKYNALESEHKSCYKEGIKDDFSRLNNWFLRIRFILQKENRLLSGREIALFYPKYDPEHTSKYTNLRNCVQQALHFAWADGLLLTYRVPHVRGLYYGLPDFFDKSGEPKKEHTFILVSG